MRHWSYVRRISPYHDAPLRLKYDGHLRYNDAILRQNYDAPLVDYDCPRDAHPPWKNRNE